MLLLFLGLVVRFLFIPNPGFEADVAYWKSWSLAASDKGPLWTVTKTNYNYPPVFVYLLWVLGKVYALFANPHDFSHYWQNTNFLYLFLAKMMPILSDLGIAILLFFLGKKMARIPKRVRDDGQYSLLFDNRRHLEGDIRNTSKVKDKDTLEVRGIPKQVRDDGSKLKKVGPALACGSGKWPLASLNGSDLHKSLPLLMAGLYLFNPVSIFDGALWGQVDSFGVVIFLLSLTLLFLKKPLWASAVFTLSFLLKLQNIIYIPLFFLFIFLTFGQKTFFKSLVASAATFFILCLEYLLKNQASTILRLMLQNADWFPYLSLNAYNPWWIVSGADGMAVSDKILTLGVVNAKTLGLILFSTSYLLCLGLIFKTRRHSEFNSESIKYQHKMLKQVQHDEMFENLILACLTTVFSFYLLLTQAHERYIFPAIVFLPLLLPYFQRKNTSKVKSADILEVKRAGVIVFFILLTLTSFYNLHNSLIHFYPLNGLPIFSSLNLKVLTIIVSFINITLFAGLLIVVLKRIHPLLFLASLSLIIFSLFFLNGDYLFRREVSLTSLKPIKQTSTFAPCQKNRSVNSNFGWKYWNRLSVNYFFYQKGFGCHANSLLAFDLGEKFKTFATDFGVDTEAGVAASVIFQVYDDNKLLYQSEKIGRFDLPSHAEIDVKGVKTLTLKVEDAGDGNHNDHGDWLRPILYR